tara:strand:+ start:541 stop:858 length:318 start_codon:yes stop_codon:yes gene_type:complete
MARTKHDKGLENILNNAIFKLIPDVKVVAKEVKFYTNHGLVCEPDGLIWNKDTLYIIEYKCSGKHRGKAKDQLDTADNYIKNDLGIYLPTRKYLASHKKKMEEIE